MYYCQKDSLHCFSFDSLAPSKFLPSFLKHLCAHQFKSNLCAAPRAFEKNGQMLDPVGNWQMPLLYPSEVFSFIQHNCYSSLFLHKQVTPTKQSQSKGFYCFCKSFMIDKCSSCFKMTVFETFTSERRRNWRLDCTNQVQRNFSLRGHFGSVYLRIEQMRTLKLLSSHSSAQTTY